MKTMSTFNRGWLIVGVCMLLASGTAVALRGGAGSSYTTTDKTGSAGQTKSTKPLPGTKYLNLRYDEDFSYLDGEPGTYREDFFDPIKYMHPACRHAQTPQQEPGLFTMKLYFIVC